MPYSTLGKNLMLDALEVVALWASLHSGDPGDNGANELSGGGYVRKAITWNPAGSGTKDDSTTPAPVFSVGAGTTVSYVGLWSQEAAGGTFYGAADVTDETFTGAGTYTLTDFDIDLNA